MPARRLALIEDIAAALTGAVTAVGVADVVVAECARMLGAEGGVLALRMPGNHLEVVAAAGEHDTASLAEAVRSGTPLWLEKSCAIPLVVNGTVTAGVAFNFAEARAFDDDEQRFLRTVAGFVAQALDRAQLFEREWRAREAAEEAVIRLGRLQSITVGLSRALDAAEVGEVVVGQGLFELGATGGSLCLVTDDGKLLRMVRSFGYEPDVASAFGEFPADADLPACDALRTGEVVTIGSIEERDERWPLLRGTPTDSRAFAVVPLSIDDRALGALSLSFADERRFSVADHAFLESLAHQCALALERARLYQAERAAHARAELAAERLSFLAEASEALASSLDLDTTLARMVRLVVPELADACSLHLSRRGRLEPVAMANADAAREELMWNLARRESDVQDGALGHVAATGEPLLATDVDPLLVDEVALDDEHRQLLHKLGVRSAAVVALQARGRVVGVLALTMTDVSDRAFVPADLPMLHELARRAAVAVDNALLYAERNEIAQTLQRSLLPRLPPAIPGLDVAASFRAGADGTVVGGDFFDLFQDGSGNWCVVVGDVCGRGVEAAAITSLVRHSLRALAPSIHVPAAMLRRMNEALLAEDTDDRFCTVTYGSIAVQERSARVQLACAGHPAPLVLRADGTVERVAAGGTLLGVLADAEPGEAEVTLRRGDALVIYTDGVTEARAATGFFGEERLRRLLERLAGATAAVIASTIEDEVVAFTRSNHPEGGGDDIAVVVVRVG